MGRALCQMFKRGLCDNDNKIVLFDMEYFKGIITFAHCGV